MTTHSEDIIRQNSQRLADLKKTSEELQRELSETRVSLERELARSAHGPGAWPDEIPGRYHGRSDEAIPGRYYTTPDETIPGRYQTTPDETIPGRYDGSPGERIPGPGTIPPQARYAVDSLPFYSPDEPPFVGEGPRYDPGTWRGEADAPDDEVHARSDEAYASDPTVGIVNHGRQSAYRRGLSRRSAIAIAGVTVVLAAVLAVIISSGGASWPASVATVQAEISRACQNPDVVSEPGQVNFACAKSTRQILWVFALLTSHDNPQFADTKTGRQGLEPITPSQGGAVAASLNLHHPYDPANPIDSIAVAARAINDIIGGATLTGANGSPVVQPGLESKSQNCLRYTGSGVVTSRQGFPGLCARQVTGTGGQAALVGDVYRKWIVGASTGAANDAGVLFTNANNPGNPQVQAILKQLGNETLAA